MKYRKLKKRKFVSSECFQLNKILRKVTSLCMLNRMRMFFYAVAKGRQPGIFMSWPECQSQTNGFNGAIFKKFRTEIEAQEFIDNSSLKAPDAKRRKFTDKGNFSTVFDKVQTKTLQESSQESLDEKFENFPEYPDEPTSSSVIEKEPQKKSRAKSLAVKKPSTANKDGTPTIPFNPPEPTVPISYNGLTFHEDAKGFVHVYTDGSCMGNGKKKAVAGIGVYFGEDHKLNVSEPVKGRPTNNNGEIQAAIRAITDAQKSGVKRLKIFTDSQFMIKSVCIWMKGWKKKNWMKADGKPVANMVEFKQLDDLIESGNMVIQWSYIPAHKGYEGNENADKLAKIGACIDRSRIL